MTAGGDASHGVRDQEAFLQGDLANAWQQTAASDCLASPLPYPVGQGGYPIRLAQAGGVPTWRGQAGALQLGGMPFLPPDQRQPGCSFRPPCQAQRQQRAQGAALQLGGIPFLQPPDQRQPFLPPNPTQKQQQQQWDGVQLDPLPVQSPGQEEMGLLIRRLNSKVTPPPPLSLAQRIGCGQQPPLFSGWGGGDAGDGGAEEEEEEQGGAAARRRGGSSTTRRRRTPVRRTVRKGQGGAGGMQGGGRRKEGRQCDVAAVVARLWPRSPYCPV